MSPTSSSRLLAGRTARSATDRTIHPLLGPGLGATADATRGTLSPPPQPAPRAEPGRPEAPPVGATVRRAVDETRALRRTAAPVAALVVLGAAACGGGGARQDAAERSGTYRVAIVRSSFPARQRVSSPARLVVDVRNAGRATLPNVSVTVDGFAARSERSDLADAQRPVWVI